MSSKDHKVEAGRLVDEDQREATVITEWDAGYSASGYVLISLAGKGIFAFSQDRARKLRDDINAQLKILQKRLN
jgi:hypothetical protein